MRLTKDVIVFRESQAGRKRSGRILFFWRERIIPLWLQPSPPLFHGQKELLDRLSIDLDLLKFRETQTLIPRREKKIDSVGCDGFAKWQRQSGFNRVILLLSTRIGEREERGTLSTSSRPGSRIWLALALCGQMNDRY